MGRLAGFSYSEVIRKLKSPGFEFDRQAKGSHRNLVEIHRQEFEPQFPITPEIFPKELCARFSVQRVSQQTDCSLHWNQKLFAISESRDFRKTTQTSRICIPERIGMQTYCSMRRCYDQ